MRGQKKAIGANKYAEKLNKLRSGQVKVHPGVEAGYREMYGHQPQQPQPSVHSQVDQLVGNNQDSNAEGNLDFGLHRNPNLNDTPAYKQVQQQVRQIQASIQAPTIKLGAIFEFAKDKGDIEIACDEQGFEYSYDGLALSALEFAKGESVPSRLKRRFKAKQLYSVADISIDLSDIADTFEKGDKLTFKITEIKSFYQRHTTEALANELIIEAEIKTDLDVDIPAKIQLKAHPLTKDLLGWTLQEIQASVQVDEIIDIIDSQG